MSEALHAAMGQRLADFYRRQYPVNTVKLVARENGVAEITARKWLDGHFPAGKHFVEMLARRGAGFAGYVMHPCGDWAARLAIEAELEQRIAEADRLLDQLKHRRVPVAPAARDGGG